MRHFVLISGTVMALFFACTVVTNAATRAPVPPKNMTKDNSVVVTDAQKKVVTIKYHRGGVLEQFTAWFRRLRAEGYSVRVDGMCASACTFGIGIMPPEKICATE